MTEHYPLGDYATRAERDALGIKKQVPIFESAGFTGILRDGDNLRAVRTGEFRAPKGGEWYLSGADPTAYRAPNDFSMEFHILKLVNVKRETRVIETIQE